MAIVTSPAPTILHPRAAAFTVEARGVERRVGVLFSATGIALVALMGVLGLIMRLTQKPSRCATSRTPSGLPSPSSTRIRARLGSASARWRLRARSGSTVTARAWTTPGSPLLAGGTLLAQDCRSHVREAALVSACRGDGGRRGSHDCQPTAERRGQDECPEGERSPDRDGLEAGQDSYPRDVADGDAADRVHSGLMTAAPPAGGTSSRTRPATATDESRLSGDLVRRPGNAAGRGCTDGRGTATDSSRRGRDG